MQASSNWYRHARLLVLTGAAAATLVSAPAPAADTTAPAKPGAGQLEEIVVTATRHEESLSKVPLSVTALGQEAIDQKGIKDFQDIVRFMPGVSIDTSGTNAISIRGISSSGGAGATGIYIDDTPIQMRALGFNPDDTLPKTFDLDRVEVLRGPQGTLFGSGSEGGTVRYIMTQPSLTKESTYMRSEFAFTQHGEPSYEAGIAHGAPIIDDVLGYRASVWYRYDGGWINRVDPSSGKLVDQNANHANTLAARLAFVLKAGERVTLTPSVMYQNSRKHDQSTWWPVYSNPGAGQFNNASPERYPVPDEYYLPSLKIEVDFGSSKLISNTSYFHRNELTGYQGSVYDMAYYQSQSWLIGSCGSASSTPVPPCSWYPLMDSSGIHLPKNPVTGASLFPSGYSTPNIMTNQQQSYTQELRWQSNDDSSRWRWTVGAFWSLSREVSIEELRDTQIVPMFNALFGINPQDWFYLAPATTGDYYYCNGAGNASEKLPVCDIYLNDNAVHDRQLAGFGEASFAITDRLKATVGGRYAKLSFDLSHHGDGLLNYIPEYRTASHSENAFTPKVGISFQADPQNLYYATYAKGFRPGGGNAPLPAYCDADIIKTGYPHGAPLTYNSDTTQSFEVGSKNNFGGQIRIASSVYYIKWHNIQQNVYVAGNCGLQFTDNLNEAVAKGFDVQAEMLIGSGFSIDAAIGYTSARYSASTILYDTSPVPPLPPIPRVLVSSGDAISGEAAIDYAPGTNPPWTVAIGAQYNFSAGTHDAFVRLDWEYASKNTWLSAVQDPVSVQYQPSSGALDATNFASLRTGITIGNWQLAGFVDNLFDSHTITSYAHGQVDQNAINAGYPSPSVQQNVFTFRPRTFGLTMTYRL